MAKWENLKNAVAAVVKTNGNKEITGANMQAVLNSIINAVGGNAGFAGIATPTTQSGIPDGPIFYIATQGGTYSYFPTDGQGTPATIQDGVISVLYNQGNGLWSVTATPMSIADGSVTTDKLANGVVTTSKLANGAVTNDKIVDGTIDGYLKIAESSIRWENMDQGSVGKDTLQDDSVIESKIKDGAVTEYKLGTNSVSQRSIINGAVTEAKLANNSVTGSKIANGTITSAKIADGTITGNEIAPNSIESSNLSYGAVDNDILADGAVTTDKLAPFAVDTGNIENKAVTKGKLDDDVVAILDEVDNKANIDGFYDTMGVGTARNLLGKTSVVDTFFRKTIGVGVAKGNGYVDKVQGESIAWNQIAMQDYSNFNKFRLNFSLSDGVATCSAQQSGAQLIFDKSNFIAGHIYYTKFYYKGTTGYIYINGMLYKKGTTTENDWVKAESLRSFPINTSEGNVIYAVIENTPNFYVKDFVVIDLTLMFGAGNEPITIEAFDVWMASHVGIINYFPYNAGVILNAMMESIKSTGTTIGIKMKELPITGITGNYLGTRSTIFPNGMRGVGNGYDEISGNSAIVRIASVKVSELEWVFVEDSVFAANIPSRKYGNGIIVLCDKYASQPRGVDKGIYAHTITDSVLVMDSAYQSVAAFKTAMGDATILYELAEPIEYTDLQDEQENDFSLPIGIEVEPLGTLETLPQNTEGEALAMCAPTLSMQFSIDAAKILTDELPNEYRTNDDDKANWQKFLALMNEKLSSTMGGTISVDDAAVGHGLDFTFAAAQAENNRDIEPIEE